MSVTARGGYQILDIPVSIPVSEGETPVTVNVPGIFEKAKNGENKPVIVSALLSDGTKVLPQFGISMGYDSGTESITVHVISTASTPTDIVFFANDGVTYAVSE